MKKVFITEFDKYCYSPELKQCQKDKKSNLGLSPSGQSLTKQRKMKNRFAKTKGNKAVTAKKKMPNDFVELITTGNGETKKFQKKLKGRRNANSVGEETKRRHLQFCVDTQKRGKQVVDGKGEVDQKKAVETVRKQKAQLLMIPVSKSNLRAPTGLKRVRAELSIEYNIFYLLSRYGDDISLLNSVDIDTLGTTRRQPIPWSCSRAWFLCSVRKNGHPWTIRTLEDASLVLTSPTLSSHISDYTLRQKIQDIIMAHDFQAFVDREYNIYRECKFRTLKFVGYYAMKKAMEQHKERYASYKKTYQCLKWENNSCALDAFLFILPPICFSVISNRMFRSKLAGSDPCFHSPVACIFAALEAVQAEDMVLSQASNWTRHLLMDIVQHDMLKKDMHRVQESWSCFVQPQQYLDISLMFSYIPALLGKGSPAFQKVDIPLLLEIPTYFARETFEISREGEDFENLGSFLFASIAQATQNGRQQISKSLYLFAFTFPEEIPSSSKFKRWLQELLLTSWSYESDRKGLPSLSNCYVSSHGKSWRIETLGIIGHSSTTENHFVSLSSSSTCPNSVWFYDGLQKNGQARCISKRVAMSWPNSKVEMEGIFVLSCLDVVE